MIPNILVAGLLVGILPAKWAFMGIIALGILWPTFLLATGHTSSFGETFWAGVFGIGNAAAGASVSQVVRNGIRRRSPGQES